MNKYYTPELEEFHVGFEYEALVDYYKQEFEKFTIDDTDSLRSICSTWDRGEVEYWRVKYLDREDIESLGWDHDYNTEPIPNREELPVSEGYLFDKQNETGELWILYHFSDNIVWIEYIKDCGGQGYLFKGTIKNKSELKKLLKQLGI